MPTIGERIRLRRMEKNIGLAELARRASLSKGYLSSLEAGDAQSPSAELLFRIANELGTTISDLLGEVESDPITPDVSVSLHKFALKERLTDADVNMLARIQYRGKRPDSEDDWRYIWESIKRTLR